MRNQFEKLRKNQKRNREKKSGKCIQVLGRESVKRFGKVVNVGNFAELLLGKTSKLTLKGAVGPANQFQ